MKQALGSLGVDGWDVSADRVVKCGITATKFRVHEHRLQRSGISGSGTVRAGSRRTGTITWPGSRSAIDQSALSDGGKARAKALFDRLAEAEAAIHNMPVEKVHLHEVGALDSIIDIVGAVFALEWFDADRIVVSPINVGSGTVRTAHGLYPVPAPATLRLLGDAPDVRQRDRRRSC